MDLWRWRAGSSRRIIRRPQRKAVGTGSTFSITGRLSGEPIVKQRAELLRPNIDVRRFEGCHRGWLARRQTSRVWNQNVPAVTRIVEAVLHRLHQEQPTGIRIGSISRIAARYRGRRESLRSVRNPPPAPPAESRQITQIDARDRGELARPTGPAAWAAASLETRCCPPPLADRYRESTRSGTSSPIARSCCAISYATTPPKENPAST